MALLLGFLGALPWVTAQTLPNVVTETAPSQPPSGLSGDSTIPPLTGGSAGEPPQLAGAPPLTAPATADAPAITLWYGATLPTGPRGDPQK